MLSQQSEYTDIIASSSSPPPSDESDRSSPDPDFSIRVDKIPAPAEDCGFRIDKEPSRPQSSYDEEARPQESTVQKVPAPSSTVSPDISPATSDSRPEVEEEEEIDLQKPLERLADHELSERINKHRTEIWDEYTAHTNELCEMIEEYNTLVALLIQKHEVGLHEELSTIVDHIRQTEAGQELLRTKVAGFFDAIKNNFANFFRG